MLANDMCLLQVFYKAMISNSCKENIPRECVSMNQIARLEQHLHHRIPGDIFLASTRRDDVISIVEPACIVPPVLRRLNELIFDAWLWRADLLYDFLRSKW